MMGVLYLRQSVEESGFPKSLKRPCGTLGVKPCARHHHFNQLGTLRSTRAYNDACIRARYGAIAPFCVRPARFVHDRDSEFRATLSWRISEREETRNRGLGLCLVMALWRKLEVPTRARRSSVFARCFVKDAKADGTGFLTEK